MVSEVCTKYVFGCMNYSKTLKPILNLGLNILDEELIGVLKHFILLFRVHKISISLVTTSLSYAIMILNYRFFFNNNKKVIF